MPEPKVSVITPVYNGSKSLTSCHESLLRQSFSDWEWILVDDHSTDNSFALMQTWKDPRIRLLQTPANSGGPALPRKLACSQASGQWLALLDQDDTWNENKLAHQLEILNTTPGLVLLGGNQIVVGQGRHKRMGDCIYRGHSRNFSAAEIYLGNPFLASTAIFSKDAYTRCGEWDTTPDLRGRDEWELWIRLSLLGGTLVDATVVGTYAWHENNLSHAIQSTTAVDYVRSKHGASFPKSVRNRALGKDFFNLSRSELKAGRIAQGWRNFYSAVGLHPLYILRSIGLLLLALRGILKR